MTSARNQSSGRRQKGRIAAYPELCRKCAVTHRRAGPGRCDPCADFAFDEGILCDLTRSVQRYDAFACHAFRPWRLSPAWNVEAPPDDPKPDALSSSDSYKYQHALALQKIRSDPDGVYVHLAYHLAWNVAKRKPVFSHPMDARRLIDDAFSACGKEIGGFAGVLWLAPDHIHVRVESDGEKSIDAVVKVLKRVSARALRRVPSLGKGPLWEDAYFAESIG